MPKMKSHRGAAKRFRRRSSGNICRSKATGSHNLTKKSSKQKKELRQPKAVHKSDMARVKRMLAS